jgi:hypothetical protein
MLPDEQRYEEQRQHAEEAKAAKVTKLGDAGLGDDGGDGSCLGRDSRQADRWDGAFLDCHEGDLNRPPNQSHIDSSH